MWIEFWQNRRATLRPFLARATVWTGGTFLLAAALLSPRNAGAVDKPQAADSLRITQPKLQVNGIDLTVKSGGDILPAKPMTLSVSALNAGTADHSATFHVQVFSSSIPSALSRVPATQQLTWQVSQTVTLRAGESKLLSFTTTPVAPNRLFDVRLASDSQQITALTLAATTRPADLPYLSINTATASTQPSTGLK
jgi:hypothetical protein